MTNGRQGAGADTGLPDMGLPDDVSVAVVGGGPVGLTAALLLARWGVRSVVLESALVHEAVGSRSICTQRDVLDVLDRVGVAAALVDEGVTWTIGRTYYREHEVLVTTFADRGRSVYPPFVNIGQSRVEQRLAERIADEPLVTVCPGHRVTRLANEPGDEPGVTLTVQTRAGPRRVRASWVLACDGARSTIRHVLGLPFEGRSFSDKFLIADVRAQLPFGAERRFFFDPEWNPGRQVLVHPQPHDVWRIDWQVPGDFDLEADQRRGDLDARIRKVVGEHPYELVWVSSYRFHQRCAPSFRSGRVLLAGDAAHVMSPFGARGLNSGIQDAENAAWKLAFVLRGWAPEGLLDSYDAERRPAAEENLRVTGDTMRFLVPQTDGERAHRVDVLTRSVTDETARAEIDSGRLAEPFWYVDSPVVTPDATRPFSPPGRGQAPAVVPGVLLPDAPVRVPGRPAVGRVRQLFGSGLVALVAPEGDRGSVEKVLAGAVSAPCDVYPLVDVDVEGVLSSALEPRPAEVWLLRPDGHVAAASTADPEELAVVARRAVGFP